MNVLCPDCNKTLSVPDAYIGQKVRCRGCQRDFVAHNDNAPPSNPNPESWLENLRITIRCASPYVLVASAVSLPFLNHSYSSGLSVLIAYCILIAALGGALALAKRKLSRPNQHLRKPIFVAACVTACILFYLYAKHDTYMMRQAVDNIDIYDTYTQLGRNHIYRRTYSTLQFPISGPCNINIKGPLAARPGSYEAERHGRWETCRWSSDPLYCNTTYVWYWYGEQITEDQWLQRTRR